jgi:hypothetical protein
MKLVHYSVKSLSHYIYLMGAIINACINCVLFTQLNQFCAESRVLDPNIANICR